MIELTLQQHQTLATNGIEAVRAIDPVTKAEYVLVPAGVYERIKMLVSYEKDWPQDAYAMALAVFARDGWDDPRMDVYDALDPRKNP